MTDIVSLPLHHHLRARIKVCGITNRHDAVLAADLGASALGFVFFRGSRRCVGPDDVKNIIGALPPSAAKVGVFVGAKPRTVLRVAKYCGLDAVQVYNPRAWMTAGYADSPFIIAARRVAGKGTLQRARALPYMPLFDTHVSGSWGGSGQRFDWGLLKGFARPYILAGGINAETIGAAIGLGPFAIDVSSGVELRPGKKDPAKMRELFRYCEGRAS